MPNTPIAGKGTRAAGPSGPAHSAKKAHSNSATTEATLKILYISQYFPPEMGAPAARVSELSRHWVQAGHGVTVLTGFPNHPDGVVRPEYRRQFRRMVFREQLDGVNVVRTWLLPFPNRKSYERILNYSSFCLSACATGSLVQCPDVVIATSPQLLVGFAGWWISRLKNVPFVLEVRDLWPESLAAVGMGDSDSRLHRAIGRIAGFLYRNANHIVVVTPAFREHLSRRWRVPAQKISIVQNGVETALFSPQLPDSALLARLKPEGRFVVSYIGTLGLAHGLDTLIAAAQRLQTAAPQVLFMLIGDGADRERIAAMAETNKLSNVLCLPPQPREKIPQYICASDACIVLLRKSEVFETVIPTKMLEFMSCARPVILGVRGQAQQLIESCRGGICIEPENPEALCDAILQLYREPALKKEFGESGREYIARNLSRKSTAIEYLEVLRGLIEVDVSLEKAAAA